MTVRIAALAAASLLSFSAGAQAPATPPPVPADVSPLYTNAGQATAAFDPRQFQFALKVMW